MAGNQPNLEELYRMGVKAARNEQHQPARMMFEQILDRHPDNIRALLWMAKIAPDQEARVMWLNRVLDVDPNNETALKVLGRVEQREGAERNQLLLKVGALAYALSLFLLSAFIIISSASA